MYYQLIHHVNHHSRKQSAGAHQTHPHHRLRMLHKRIVVIFMNQVHNRPENERNEKKRHYRIAPRTVRANHMRETMAMNKEAGYRHQSKERQGDAGVFGNQFKRIGNDK
ncbi:hypothetical protein SDC9_157198 [bioreactor metagenome]|uniref:Uncharacterized protein n=1 Tax=bioreactor metagenome TaxID=1076179 RepID=A0A645F6B9_9ZZZZ